MEIVEILKTLPHRYPFLLIDRILDIVPGERIVAIKEVTANEPFLQGYSPTRLMMPGLLIVEAMAQAGGVLALTSLPEADASSATPYFMRMDKVEFMDPVLPGQQVVIEVSFLKKSSWAVKFSCDAKIGNKKISEAELTATLGRQS